MNVPLPPRGRGTATNLQARYAGADLAPPQKVGSHLAVVMWALTVGSVTGPSLAAVANRTWIGWFGGADYVGPMVAIGLVSTLTAVLVAVMLRPDPLLTARAVSGEAEQAKRSVADGFRIARTNPAVRAGVVSATLGHFVMVGVMAMTALHLRHGIEDLNEALTVVGVILGLHIGGMYALSPVFGRLVDRHGANRVIGLGIGLLLAACAVAGTSASHAHIQITIGLILLGLGWSAMTVASAALITGAVGPGDRPSTQGFSDMVMGLAAMVAGIASGPIVEWFGYGVLNAVAAVVVAAVVPVLLLRRAS
jgi:MFS family permease